MTGRQKRGTLRTTGVPSQAELEASPGYPSERDLAVGPMAVIECCEDIPCNPCELACPTGAIHVGRPITNQPTFRAHACVGCEQCIPVCPGQAIFGVDVSYGDETAAVSFPYEFFPMPAPGELVEAVNRTGDVVCQARVLRARSPRAFDRTTVVTIEVPRKLSMVVRSIRQLA